MKSKDSKAQIEVWEWKEKAYNEIKGMPLDKAIAYIMKQAGRLGKKLRLKGKTPKK